jgi:hypothetical protein
MIYFISEGGNKKMDEYTVDNYYDPCDDFEDDDYDNEDFYYDEPDWIDDDCGFDPYMGCYTEDC